MPPDSEVPARHVRRRFTTASKPQVKKLEQENRRLTSRLQKAEALLAFQEKYRLLVYVMLDIFSRYVVGWMLAPHESAALAERLIAETCGSRVFSQDN